MPRRHDEEYARRLFEAYLQCRHVVSSEVCTSDPPDYWFCVDGERYAVEVTRLEQERNAPGGKLHSRIGDNTSLARWAAALEAKSKEAGVLSGRYLISFRGNVESFTLPLRQTAERQILDFIGTTSSDDVHAPMDYSPNDRVYLVVHKMGPGEGSLGLAGLATGWSADIEQNALNALQDSILTKRAKMQNVPGPCVLVLLNGYWLAGPQTYSRALARIQDEFFAGIYLIHDDRCNVLRDIWASNGHSPAV